VRFMSASCRPCEPSQGYVAELSSAALAYVNRLQKYFLLLAQIVLR
jgi:hypothetical protein